MIRDSLEIYHSDKLIAYVDTSMVPAKGSLISIRKETWKVINIEFALDYSNDSALRGMRCNVYVEKIK